MQHKNWSCIKCGHNNYEIGEMRVAGSFWQKIFNVQRTKFSYLSDVTKVCAIIFDLSQLKTKNIKYV